MHFNKRTFNVFAGCCGSAVSMELLMQYAPHSANFITFLQFLFISIQGLVFTSKFGTVRPKIPMNKYICLVLLFFVTSFVNNSVYILHVQTTMHMIIRSASSPASMIVSWIYKKRPPKLSNAIGSILISVGVATAMYGNISVTKEDDSQFLYWCFGVTFLVLTLFLGAFTGLEQEIMFSQYGRHPEEMMFYTHFLSMVFFIPMLPHFQDIFKSLEWSIWGYIILNIACQFYCTQSVHDLAAKESTVTVTFILTIRKFVSLIISALVFKNNITPYHVMGGLFVFIGTFIFFDFFLPRKQKSVSFKKD